MIAVCDFGEYRVVVGLLIAQLPPRDQGDGRAAQIGPLRLPQHFGLDALFPQRRLIGRVFSAVLARSRLHHPLGLHRLQDRGRPADVILVHVGEQQRLQGVDPSRAQKLQNGGGALPGSGVDEHGPARRFLDKDAVGLAHVQHGDGQRPLRRRLPRAARQPADQDRQRQKARHYPFHRPRPLSYNARAAPIVGAPAVFSKNSRFHCPRRFFLCLVYGL